MPPAYLKGPPSAPSRRVNWWCEGKEPFESAVIAHEVAARRTDLTRQAYRCASCGAWHIDTARKEAPPVKVLTGLVRSEGRPASGD